MADEVLGPEQISRSLRVSVIEGAFATGHMSLTGGVFLTGLALHLGARPFHIGLLAAIPAVLSLLGLTAGGLVRRVGSRRRLTVWTAGLGRISLVLLVPFLLFSWPLSLVLLFAVKTVHWVLLALAAPTWSSWMSDLVPARRRGRFFGRRNAMLGIIAIAITFFGSRGLDWFKDYNPDLGYGLAYLLAVIFAVVSAVVLTRQGEPPLPPRPRRPLRERLFGPLLEERNFRRLMLFLGLWFLTGTIASPFYIVHLLTNLEFSYTAVGVYAAISGLSGIIFQLFWGWYIDRFGAKPATVISFVFNGVAPLLWIFATPSFRLPIWLDGVFNGVFWTGANLGLLNILLALADRPERKESYFAIFGVVVGLGTFLAALAGGLIAQWLAGFELTLFGRQYGNYHLLFLLNGLTRFIWLPLLLRVEVPRSRTVVRTFQVLSSFALNRLNYGKGIFVNSLRTRFRG